MICTHARFLAVAAVAATTTPSVAAVIVDNDATFPSTPEVLAATPAQAGNDVVLDASSRGTGQADTVISQTFSPSSTIVLDKAYIEYSDAVVGEAIELRIQTVDNINANAYTAGTNLLSSAATYTFVAGDASSSQRILEFDFTGVDEITLTGGQGYAFEVASVDDDNNTDFVWLRSSNQISAPGKAYTDRDDINFSSGERRDMSLAIVAVPEPASIALLAAGGLCLLPRRRRAAA